MDFSGLLVPRAVQSLVTRALGRSPVVAIVGPRQCGKTTLARQLVPADSPNYFDLEDPVSLARLDQQKTALRDLAGTVVIDEVQHRPDLFPVLRVLADRSHNPAQFLVLGSAGPALLRQSAESLAGRIEYIELTGLQVAEVGATKMQQLWVRGGFPRSFLADTDADSMAWRKAFVRTFIERDLPQFRAELGVPVLHRFLAMLAHCHGQSLNVAGLATALGVARARPRPFQRCVARAGRGAEPPWPARLPASGLSGRSGRPMTLMTDSVTPRGYSVPLRGT